MRPSPEKAAQQERAYFHAVNICNGRANGFWLPIIRHLANQRMPEALTLLADFESNGRPGKSHLDYRLAWRLGSPVAAYNLAIDSFNRGRLAPYRRWLQRAAKTGDSEAKNEARRFETRLPHADAQRIGRHRPHRRSELR